MARRPKMTQRPYNIILSVQSPTGCRPSGGNDSGGFGVGGKVSHGVFLIRDPTEKYGVFLTLFPTSNPPLPLPPPALKPVGSLSVK